MKRKVNAREPDIPVELRDHLDDILREYRAIRRKEKVLRTRVEARTAPLRNAMKELFDRMDVRLARLEKRRNDIANEFLATWAREFPELPRVKLPFAYVLKRRNIKVEVLDKREVIDALDRLDRLDLVDEVVDEKGLRGLARKGKLARVPEDVLRIDDKTQIQVVKREEE